jgi:uncharacterized cupin superfamily protein
LSEPHQTPEFDEFTLIISGKKQFEIDGEIVTLEKGQSILLKKELESVTATHFQNLVNTWPFVFLHFLWSW